jgi:hypothetical protein
MADASGTPSEETRQRAELAKQYIENMYSNKSKALNDRQHRCASWIVGCLITASLSVHNLSATELMIWPACAYNDTCDMPRKILSCRRVALEQQLERMGLTEEEKSVERQRLARKEKEFSRLQRHQMTADDFDKLAIVGRGAFGEVRIVREKASGKLYAMKKLKKSDTVRRNQVRTIHSSFTFSLCLSLSCV